ncbi:hypothetical protein GC170_14825 [bacterium]|nr:hypothetical protein [bacterium]
MMTKNLDSPLGIGIFVFMFVFGLIDLAIWTYFGKYGRIENKRSLLVPFIVIHCFLMLGFLFLLGVPMPLLPLFLGFLVCFWYWHYRTIRFCESCTLCILTPYAFGPAAYCPHCGAKIEK